MRKSSKPSLSLCVVRMINLGQSDCLELFRRRVCSLSGPDVGVSDEEIYDLTKGLPLAVLLLAGLIYYKEHDQEQWDEIIKYLKANDEISSVYGKLWSRIGSVSNRSWTSSFWKNYWAKKAVEEEKDQDGEEMENEGDQWEEEEVVEEDEEEKREGEEEAVDEEDENDEEEEREEEGNDVKQYMRIVEQILAASYATMPSIYKACFLYLAAIPLNMQVNLDKLVRLWCAEGIFQSESQFRLTEEMVAVQCVRYLV